MPFALLVASCVLAAAGEPVDFNRDIRPILSQHCFACHGFDAHARKAGLRLDRAEFAYATNADGVTPIKPGDLAGSELWKRVSATDPDEIMPPPSAHRELSDAQRAMLKAWIEQGAQYAEHWAFVPAMSPAPPAVPGGVTPVGCVGFFGRRRVLRTTADMGSGQLEHRDISCHSTRRLHLLEPARMRRSRSRSKVRTSTRLQGHRHSP